MHDSGDGIRVQPDRCKECHESLGDSHDESRERKRNTKSSISSHIGSQRQTPFALLPPYQPCEGRAHLPIVSHPCENHANIRKSKWKPTHSKR